MIKTIEKDYLKDEFIIKPFIDNININDNIYFNKNNIYYFGNYDEGILKDIKKKIYKNKNRIKKAIENNVHFIIHGNSIDIFNNTFKNNNINLFTAYDNNKNIIYVKDLNQGIDSLNFRYKNLKCIK